MKIDKYHKITKWINSSIGQSTVIQELDKKGLYYSTLTKHEIEEDMLILKMAPISFVV